MTKNLRALPLLALLAASPALAQEGQPLSLDDAVRTAQQHNPAYRKTLAEVEAARADVRRSRGAFLPTLNVGVSSGAGFSRSFNARNPIGDVDERDEALETRSSDMRHSLSLGSLTLFDAGARNKELRATRALESAAGAGVRAEEARMRGEVARRYWKAVQAERAIRLEEALLAGAKEQLETTRRLLRVAVKTPVDVLGAEVKVSEQEQALDRARGEHRRALLELRQEMGVLEGGSLRFTTEPAAVFDPAGLDAAALVQGALAASPRLARAGAQENAALSRLGAARAARWPTLSMNASVSRSQYFAGYGGLVTPNPRNQYYGVGFDLSLPLFTGWRTSQQIVQAETGLTRARADGLAERLSVETEVRAALIDLENAFGAARHAERTLALARERLEMAEELYRVGALPFADLQDAVDGAARAERDHLKTRFDFAAALATLEERAGAAVAPPEAAAPGAR